ncbi:MAG: hypothetical protein ACE5OZ_07950 [Candidatus Heimdallarchaeota archaeon]
MHLLYRNGTMLLVATTPAELAHIRRTNNQQLDEGTPSPEERVLGEALERDLGNIFPLQGRTVFFSQSQLDRLISLVKNAKILHHGAPHRQEEFNELLVLLKGAPLLRQVLRNNQQKEYWDREG